MCVCVRTEDEEEGDALAGTKVRVKYGRGKTQKIYEAHIKKTDVDNGEQFYLVHYYGWNVRSEGLTLTPDHRGSWSGMMDR